MTKAKAVQIDIFIDGEVYGSRFWSFIPRACDSIKIGGVKKGWYTIDEVQWHGDDYPVVSLICSHIGE